MSNIQTGAERMPHDLSHLGFLAGQIGRLITISTTPVIAGDSFEMDAVGALRLSPLRRGLAIDSRSEERFSRNAETDLVCRLLLEKKKIKYKLYFIVLYILFKTLLCIFINLIICFSDK